MDIGVPIYLKEAFSCQVPTAALSFTPPRPQQKKLPVYFNPVIMPITWRKKASIACGSCHHTHLRVKYSSPFLSSNTYRVCSANGSWVNLGDLCLVPDAMRMGSNVYILSSRRHLLLTVRPHAQPATNSREIRLCEVSLITLTASLLVAWLLYPRHSSSPP